MTDEELRIIASGLPEEMTMAERLEVFRLARRGLRAEREVCGTCALAKHCCNDVCPDMHARHFCPEWESLGCSRWRAKDGG